MVGKVSLPSPKPGVGMSDGFKAHEVHVALLAVISTWTMSSVRRVGA